jgi:hydrogenase/urease accessory protein HupE
VFAIALLAALPGDVRAHEVRPGYLELTERSAGRFDVLWKVPTRGGMRLGLDARLPETCVAASPTASYLVPGAVIERWSVVCEAGLVGGSITIDRLEGTLTDVLVRIDFADAPAQTARLRPSAPSFTVPAAPSGAEVAATYLALGVEHILGGIDHLLFVLALLLIVKGWRRLVGTVTAFTIAHSITLALATLGFVHVPPAPVEAVIALSILFLAVEIVHGRQGRPGLAERYPWVVAFTFGLLHGFGFAGALSEVGLPEAAIPLALLLFNVGVEVGQLLFIGLMLAVAWIGRRGAARWPAWIRQAPAYGIGAVAAYWTIQRVLSFWS